MPPSDIERIAAFEHRLAKCQASEVVELPFGYAVLQAEFPLSHFHNRLVVDSPAPPAEIMAAADEVLGGAGLRHRYVSIDGHLGGGLGPAFAAAGYEHETIATMIYSGPVIEAAAGGVEVVSLEALRPTIVADWRVAIPEATDEELRQLADRTALSARGAELTLLAVRDGDTIVAHAELYLDRADDIAQFESLVTHRDHRGRGHGNALLRDALWRGHQARRELFFLTADVDDWPEGWYRRRGFVDAARSHHFSRHQVAD